MRNDRENAIGTESLGAALSLGEIEQPATTVGEWIAQMEAGNLVLSVVPGAEGTAFYKLLHDICARVSVLTVGHYEATVCPLSYIERFTA